MDKETILNLYQKYRLYIFPAVVALSSLILITFVIYPQIIKLITNQKDEGEIINKSKFLEVKAQTLESYDLTDLNRKVSFALNSYPSEKDYVSTLGLLQNIVSQSGFSTTSISLGSNSSKSGNAQSYDIKLDVVGPSTLLSSLLSNIESSSRLMRVNNVDITTGKDPNGASMSLNVGILYSSVPTASGSIDSPLPELSQKDEGIIAKLAQEAVLVNPQQTTTQLGPRGRANPFE